ncbi:hypothetical protein [Sphingopyxis sp. NJF-3]
MTTQTGDKPMVTQADMEALSKDLLWSIPVGYHKAIFEAFARRRVKAEQETLSREQSRDVGRERLLGLEWTEDGYSLRTPYDGDADGDGRAIIVGGDIVVTFADSDEGEEVREAFIAALTTDQSQAERLRDLIRESLYHLRLDDGAKAYHEKACAALSETRP